MFERFLKKAHDKGIQAEISKLKNDLIEKNKLYDVVMGVLKDLISEVSYCAPLERIITPCMSLKERENKNKFRLKTESFYQPNYQSKWIRLACEDHLEVAKFLDDKIQQLKEEMNEINREYEKWDNQ